MSKPNYNLFNDKKALEFANEMKNLYVAYMQAGFTEQQSMEIIKTIINALFSNNKGDRD